MKLKRYFLRFFLPVTTHFFAIIFGFFLASRIYSSSVSLPTSSNLISLNSEEGERLLTNSFASKDYLPLSTHFITQTKLAYCGVASMAMILNALPIPTPTSPESGNSQSFTQNNVLNDKTQQLVSSLKINFLGMTLAQLGQLLKTYPVNSEVYYAQVTSLEKFRNLAISNLEESDNYIVVNYSRQLLAQRGAGHISPLAAYNSETDRFLVLDVARYRYPPVWVKAEVLWQAMRTTDPESKKSRGFILVSKNPTK